MKKKDEKTPGRIDLSEEQVRDLQKKLETGELNEGDRELLLKALNAMVWLSRMVQAKKLSLRKLLRIFGGKTEKKNKDHDDKNPPSSKGGSGGGRPKGSGKKGKEDFPGAKRRFHPHPDLNSGDRCPDCARGNLYSIDSGNFIHIKGNAPLEVTIYEREKLRCSGCGTIFTAPLPEGVNKKWDESADAMIALLKYGTGMPFHRLEGLQGSMGVPIAASTQWERVENLLNSAYPSYQHLLEVAARGDMSFIDDTGNKILSLKEEIEKSERKGVFTTGIVSKSKDQEVVLYFTGNKHAGENLEKLLEKRPEELPLMMQMSDALSRNIPKSETAEGFCNVHARRNFLDAEKDRKKEVDFVLGLYSKIFELEAKIKERGLSAEARLKLHKKKSGRVLRRLRRWCLKCFYLKKVDPEEGLGRAIQYVLNHWKRLTAFTRIPGMAIENNEAERALKLKILERKNSYFFRTSMGALASDVLGSLIQTAKRAGKNPFDYLVALHKNKKAVSTDPEKWLPWNFEERLTI